MEHFSASNLNLRTPSDLQHEANWRVWHRSARREKMLASIAAARGWAFTPAIAKPSYPGLMFKLGDMRIGEEIVESPDGRLRLGNYSFYDGDDFHITGTRRGFFMSTMRIESPHLYLRARRALSYPRLLPFSFARSERLSLEGDFDRCFDLYAPGDQKREALQVLTPSEMALLCDLAAGYDVEIVGRRLILYSFRRLDLTRSDELDQKVELLRALGTGLEHRERPLVSASLSIPAHPAGQRPTRPRSLRESRSGSVMVVVFLVALFSYAVYSAIAGH